MGSTGVVFPDQNAVIIQEVVQLKWSILESFQFLVYEIEKIGKYILQNSHSVYKEGEKLQRSLINIQSHANT